MNHTSLTILAASSQFLNIKWIHPFASCQTLGVVDVSPKMFWSLHASKVSTLKTLYRALPTINFSASFVASNISMSSPMQRLYWITLLSLFNTRSSSFFFEPFFRWPPWAWTYLFSPSLFFSCPTPDFNAPYTGKGFGLSSVEYPTIFFGTLLGFFSKFGGSSALGIPGWMLRLEPLSTFPPPFYYLTLLF